MTELKAAAQLYTLRNHVKTADDFSASMKKVRDIGYRAVQISGIGPIPHETVKQITDDNGLTICNTHISFDDLRENPAAVIAQHKLWECLHVALGSMPGTYTSEGEEGYRRFAADATEAGRRLAQDGLTFSYHNHSYEFVRFGDRSGLDIIFSESDPQFLQAELDTYWIRHGGDDPVTWIRRMQNRMPVIHFKDMALEDGKPYMVEVGEGILEWPAIISACREAGVEWAAVEQDECRRDPFESMAISYRNLQRLGLR